MSKGINFLEKFKEWDNNKPLFPHVKGTNYSFNCDYDYRKCNIKNDFDSLRFNIEVSEEDNNNVLCETMSMNIEQLEKLYEFLDGQVFNGYQKKDNGKEFTQKKFLIKVNLIEKVTNLIQDKFDSYNLHNIHSEKLQEVVSDLFKELSTELNSLIKES